MGIQQTEVHKKVIKANFTDSEIKQILLDYVLRSTGLNVSESSATVKLTHTEMALGGDGGFSPGKIRYSAVCDIEVKLPNPVDHSECCCERTSPPKKP